MFYWFVLVSFNLNKSKTFGWGSEDMFFCLLTRAIDVQCSASCLVAKQLLQMADGVAQLHVGGCVGIQR